MNLSRISMAVLLAALMPGLAQSPAAMAQGGRQMYRCGNNFQDRPCDGAAAGAAISGSAAGSTAKPAPAAVPEAPKSGTAGGTAGATAGGIAAGTAGTGAAAPVLTKAQQQRQIRCENFGRQFDELKARQEAAPQQADAIGVQIRSLESRMNADRC